MKLWALTSSTGHVTYVRDRESFERAYYPSVTAEEVEVCGFGIGAGWHPARCGKPTPCPEHGNLKCHQCGAPATEACSFAGSQFVCGMPTCTMHAGNCGRHA